MIAIRSVRRSILPALAAIGMAVFLVVAPFASAQTTGRPTTPDSTITPIHTEVPIPQSPIEQGVSNYSNGMVRDLADYIQVLYNFLISIAGVLAAVMIVIGGFQYLTSAGDSSKTGAAKKRIVDALIGLMLALSAYLLLNTINPALVSFKPISGSLTTVSTQLAFLPFCEELAASMKVDMAAVVNAGGNGSPKCGDGGYILQKTTSNGNSAESRLWCVYRGTKQTPNADVADYGCADADNIEGRGHSKTLSVCMPYGNKSAGDMEKMFKANTKVTGFGKCQACVGFTDSSMAALGLTVGDAACRAWQNVANNGNPGDDTFKLSKKKIIQDSRNIPVDGGKVFSGYDRVYYCGYSQTYKACVYVGVDCKNPNFSKGCTQYESETYDLQSADIGPPGSSEIVQKSNLDLGSKWARTSGNAEHLIPVCSGDPCDVGGPSGCGVGGLAGLRNTAGIGEAVGGTVRMGVAVMSGGLLGSISCTKN